MCLACDIQEHLTTFIVMIFINWDMSSFPTLPTLRCLFVSHRPLWQNSLKPGSAPGLHSPQEAQFDALGAQVGRPRGPRGVKAGRNFIKWSACPKGCLGEVISFLVNYLGVRL